MLFLHKTCYVDDPQGQEDEVELPLKRSTMQRRCAILDDYIVFLSESDYDISHVVDPVTFHDVVSSPHSGMWLETMKNEMCYIIQNEVWELVELLYVCKLIGCK